MNGVAGMTSREPASGPATDSGGEGSPSLRLSIIVLQWDQLHLTRACVESIRKCTDIPYELIIVDNGSEDEARSYAERSADRFIGNPNNFGFAAGMNQGLREARGEWVAFVNNDTELPAGWATSVLDAASASELPGIVCPAVTTAGNPRAVRAEPGDTVEILLPFERPPSAVVWVMRTDVARRLDGFDERFRIASGEDLDLAFKVWTNGLDILIDQRVLVEHLGHGTSDEKLEDRRELWSLNRNRFFRKWEDLSEDVPNLGRITRREFERNRAIAASVVIAMRREREAIDHYKAKVKDKQVRFTELSEKLEDRKARVHELQERFEQSERELALLQADLDERRSEVEELSASLSENVSLLDDRVWVGRVARRIWAAARWMIPPPVRHRLVRRFRR